MQLHYIFYSPLCLLIQYLNIQVSSIKSLINSEGSRMHSNGQHMMSLFIFSPQAIKRQLVASFRCSCHRNTILACVLCSAIKDNRKYSWLMTLYAKHRPMLLALGQHTYTVIRVLTLYVEGKTPPSLNRAYYHPLP